MSVNLLWFNFILGINLISFLSYLIIMIIHYHTPNTGKYDLKPLLDETTTHMHARCFFYFFRD